MKVPFSWLKDYVDIDVSPQELEQQLLSLIHISTDESELWASYEELLKQKKLLQAYVMDQVFSKMATGEAAIAPYYACLLYTSNQKR